MKKHIVIIGGGISGLALLHYLKKKHAGNLNVGISLLEKNGHLGGTIQSLVKDGCLFETGPNGFLDSKKRTLEFVEELDLQDSLIKANDESSIRYLSVNNTLHQLPTNPKSFLSFKLLNWYEKFRILGEVFIPKQSDPDESVYDFGKRRLGEKFTQIFLDPMVSGVYGGDVKKANLKAVFPRIYAMEEEYGSLFKAMIKIRKAQKSQDNGQLTNSSMGSPTGTLTSFREGVGQLINRIGQKYSDDIHLNREVRSISCSDNQFTLHTNEHNHFTSDELYISAPAYNIGSMIRGVNNRLSLELEKVNYAPMVVVGLIYKKEYFSEKPEGYGYLIPSSEQKEILGVLFEGNIFPGRCQDDQVLFRVMIGGARHPDILDKSKDELIEMASREVETMFKKKEGLKDDNSPRELFYVPWKKAIPQYDQAYCGVAKIIESELAKNPKLHLVANYLRGVSLNDCIENAYQNAQKSTIN